MSDFLKRYNYEMFSPETYTPWMNFADSPAVGDLAPDFPLWRLENNEGATLSQIWASHLYTVVEFGSFT